eukprot:symbB.v1.2.025714.t1/scaffold2509.1/size77380/1
MFVLRVCCPLTVPLMDSSEVPTCPCPAPVLKLLSDIQVDRCADECWNTHPIPWKRNQEAYQLRYVFGYAMDGSDLPCYILWPTRTVEQSFWCIDARMHFKVGNYRDGSWESNIRMLTGTIKVDWIQLPVELYLAALPTLKRGVIAGVFRQKGAAPWGITRAEKLQLSVFLPNDLSLEDWYAGVYGLPTVWPEASMLGADNLRKVAGYDFHLLRKKYDVRSMRIPVERKTSADKRGVDQDMVAKEESGSDAESGWSGVSDNSSTDSECTILEASSVASDQDRFDTAYAYEAFRDLPNGLYNIDLTRYYNIDLTRYSRGVTSEDAAGVQLLDGQEKLQGGDLIPIASRIIGLVRPPSGCCNSSDKSSPSNLGYPNISKTLSHLSIACSQSISSSWKKSRSGITFDCTSMNW